MNAYESRIYSGRFMPLATGIDTERYPCISTKVPSPWREVKGATHSRPRRTPCSPASCAARLIRAPATRRKAAPSVRPKMRILVQRQFWTPRSQGDAPRSHGDASGAFCGPPG